MIRRLPLCAGLVSLAVAILLGVFLSLPTFHSSYGGGLSRLFLQDIVSDIAKGIGNPNSLAPTIPETVCMCFQMTFAIITPALIAGAFAERMKFSSMLWFIGFEARSYRDPRPLPRA
jgi:ammonium transporter, Amt family